MLKTLVIMVRDGSATWDRMDHGVPDSHRRCASNATFKTTRRSPRVAARTSDAGRYLTFPGLLRRPGSGELALQVINPNYAKEIDLDEQQARQVVEALDAFQRPASLDEFRREHPTVGDDVIGVLIAHNFLVREDELEFLEHGFLQPARSPIGEPVGFWELDQAASAGRWCVLGAPVDWAAGGRGGARHGPDEIRRAFASVFPYEIRDLLDFDYRRVYRGYRVDTGDIGDVDTMDANLSWVGRRLEKVIDDVVARGMRPMVLGGDHSITHFVLRALGRKFDRIGILHFDAHSDLQADGGLTHANVFRYVLANPSIVSLLQMGLRGFEVNPEHARSVDDPRLSFITAREMASGNALAQIEKLPRDVPYYITVDVDCFDVPLVPETGTPKIAGISYDRASDVIDFAARHLRIIGADFVEVSEGRESPNSAATIASRLLLRILLGDKPFDQLASHAYRYPR